jgi:hypothetical protein
MLELFAGRFIVSTDNIRGTCPLFLPIITAHLCVLEVSQKLHHQRCSLSLLCSTFHRVPLSTCVPHSEVGCLPTKWCRPLKHELDRNFELYSPDDALEKEIMRKERVVPIFCFARFKVTEGADLLTSYHHTHSGPRRTFCKR